MNQTGIFLDRDGTINHEVDFLRSPKDLRLIDRSADAIREANLLGLKVFIVTNQSGIARGILTEEQLNTIHQVLRQQLRESNAAVDAIYYCPHHPEAGELPYRQDCNCRKPKTGMLAKAAKDFNIDLKHSFVIGDKMMDIQTGKNCGATSILVLTGYGKEELELCKEHGLEIDFVAENLYDAMQIVKRIVQQEQIINR